MRHGPTSLGKEQSKGTEKNEGYIRVCHSGDNNILLHLPALLKPSADIAKIRAITLSTTKMYFILCFFFRGFLFRVEAKLLFRKIHFSMMSKL